MSKRSSSAGLWPAIVGLAALAVVLAVISIVLSSTASHSLAVLTATPVTTASTSPLPTTATDTPEGQATQDARATILQTKNQLGTERAIALSASPLPSSTSGPTAISNDEYTKAQWRQLGFNVENAWGGYVNGSKVSVFAGAWSADPDQGVLQVIWIYPYLAQSVKGQFLTPDKHGSVHITGGDNDRLILVSTDNTTYYFDVPGLTFAPSLTEVVPTIIPPATETAVIPVTTPAPTGYPIASETAAP